jgi:hypothetical protein
METPDVDLIVLDDPPPSGLNRQIYVDQGDYDPPRFQKLLWVKLVEFHLRQRGEEAGGAIASLPSL